jgi:C2 domain
VLTEGVKILPFFIVPAVYSLYAGLPDPFAKVTIDGSGQCHSTEPCKNSLDPKWNQHFDL